MVRKKQPGFTQVDFFAGINTKTKKDDRRVSFVARNLGKKSKLPKPKKVRALRELEGIKVPKEMGRGIPTGLLERGGNEFDKNFGLGKQKPFESKVGIDSDFGKNSFDTDFTKGFIDADFVNQPSAIDPVDPDVRIDDEMEDQFNQEFSEEAPSLLDSIPKINQGSKIPLTDEEAERAIRTKRKRERIPDSGFEDVRFKALESGGAPLSPEEQDLFNRGKGFRGQAGTR